MSSAAGQQKRTHSENSLEEGPPAKIQPPKLVLESVESDVVTSPVVIIFPWTPAAGRPGSFETDCGR